MSATAAAFLRRPLLTGCAAHSVCWVPPRVHSWCAVQPQLQEVCGELLLQAYMVCLCAVDCNTLVTIRRLVFQVLLSSGCSGWRRVLQCEAG
jgi:hypothetical protein